MFFVKGVSLSGPVAMTFIRAFLMRCTPSSGMTSRTRCPLVKERAPQPQDSSERFDIDWLKSASKERG